MREGQGQADGICLQIQHWGGRGRRLYGQTSSNHTGKLQVPKREIVSKNQDGCFLRNGAKVDLWPPQETHAHTSSVSKGSNEYLH